MKNKLQLLTPGPTRSGGFNIICGCHEDKTRLIVGISGKWDPYNPALKVRVSYNGLLCQFSKLKMRFRLPLPAQLVLCRLVVSEVLPPVRSSHGGQTLFTPLNNANPKRLSSKTADLLPCDWGLGTDYIWSATAYNL